MTPGWTSVDRADPLDDAGEQHDREVGRVLADPVVGQRHELVASRRQPHRARAVDRARCRRRSPAGSSNSNDVRSRSSVGRVASAGRSRVLKRPPHQPPSTVSSS